MKQIFIKTNQPLRGGVLLKELLIIRGRKCERCGLTTWLNQPITLQAHHIDGDKTNNEQSNLELLCPNCHSYTDNFGAKNIKKQEVSDEDLLNALQSYSSIRQALLSVGLSDGSVNYKRAKKLLANNTDINLQEKEFKTQQMNFCQDCGAEIGYQATYCTDCGYRHQRKVLERPDRETLKNLIRTKSFVQIGKEFSVSDNAIRKWCISYGLPSKKVDIKKYNDQEWLDL